MVTKYYKQFADTMNTSAIQQLTHWQRENQNIYNVRIIKILPQKIEKYNGAAIYNYTIFVKYYPDSPNHKRKQQNTIKKQGFLASLWLDLDKADGVYFNEANTYTAAEQMDKYISKAKEQIDKELKQEK